MYQKSCIKFLSLFLFFLFISNSISDNYPEVEHISFIGHLNFDCAQDTVIASINDSTLQLQTVIYWGVVDSSHCGDTITHDVNDSILTKTTIKYPNWDSLSVGCTFFKFNQDTLYDMIFSIKGRLSYQDTSRVISVFAQKGLDTLDEISISAIDTFQTTPFYGMDLIMNTHLKGDTNNFTSNRKRLFLEQVYLVVRDTTIPSLPMTKELSQINPEYKVYPNPASILINIEFKNIEAGNYFINLIDHYGNELISEAISVQQLTDITKLINTRNFASGRYTLMLYKNNEIEYTFPLMIIH